MLFSLKSRKWGLHLSDYRLPYSQWHQVQEMRRRERGSTLVLVLLCSVVVCITAQFSLIFWKGRGSGWLIFSLNLQSTLYHLGRQTLYNCLNWLSRLGGRGRQHLIIITFPLPLISDFWTQIKLHANNCEPCKYNVPELINNNKIVAIPSVQSVFQDLEKWALAHFSWLFLSHNSSCLIWRNSNYGSFSRALFLVLKMSLSEIYGNQD